MCPRLHYNDFCTVVVGRVVVHMVDALVVVAVDTVFDKVVADHVVVVFDTVGAVYGSVVVYAAEAEFDTVAVVPVVAVAVVDRAVAVVDSEEVALEQKHHHLKKLLKFILHLCMYIIDFMLSR